MGGSIEDAKDAFQNSLIILMKKIRGNKFMGDSKLSTFFIGIVKNVWLRMYRENKKYQPDNGTDPIAPPDDRTPGSNNNELKVYKFKSL